MDRRAFLRGTALAGGAALAGCTGVGGLARQGPPPHLEWCHHPDRPPGEWQEYRVAFESPATVLDHRDALPAPTMRAAGGRYRDAFERRFGVQPGEVDWTATVGLQVEPGPEITVVTGSFDRQDVIWTVETDPLLGYREAGTVRGAPLYLDGSTRGVVVDDGLVVAVYGERPERALREAFAVRAGDTPGFLAASRDLRRVAGALGDATWSAITVTPRSEGLGWRSWGYGFDLRGDRTGVVEALVLIDSAVNDPDTDPSSWDRYRSPEADLSDVRVRRDDTLVVARGTLDTADVRFGVSPFSAFQ